MLIKKLIFLCSVSLMVMFSSLSYANDTINIPILCYHNLNPTVPGSMNLTPHKLEQQIKWLKDNGFHIIALKEAVLYLQGKKNNLPSKPVVITADDGWKSTYHYLYPLAKKYQFPVTLFVYPSVISNGKNTMTWGELKELQNTGLFDIEGHTYWHPNFKQEQKRLSPENYKKFVINQLVTSKKIIEQKLGTPVTLLAWPFGIYNQFLEAEASKAGYDMAFSIDDEAANRSYRSMAQPRFMIIEAESMKKFGMLLNKFSMTR